MQFPEKKHVHIKHKGQKPVPILRFLKAYD